MNSFLDRVNEQYIAGTLGNITDAELFYREMSNEFTGSNQARLETHKNYSGSGKLAFGGAQEWGFITLGIAIPPEISNTDGQALLTDLRAVLEKHNYIKKA